MKHFRFLVIVFLAISAFMHTACNDPTVIGSDLLSGDQLDIEFTDTITFNTYNVTEDSILTFIPNFGANIESFPLGKFEDPIFGTAKSGVYIQPTRPSSSPPDFNANTDNLILDSVVLVLPYNARASYGNLLETYSLDVFQLAEQLTDTATLYSNSEFAKGDQIGFIDYMPTVEDSTEIFISKDTGLKPDSLVKIQPQLRIPLTMSNFDNDLFKIDTNDIGTVEAFEAYLKGIYIKPTTTNSGMPSFNFRSNFAGIRVYYHSLDSTYSNYLFPIFLLNVVTAKYEHDLSTSVLNLENDFIGEDATYTDSLLFIQGMSGINFVVEIPNSENLSDKVINKAELIFPILTLTEDDPQYFPAEQLVVSEVDDDGTVSFIDDLLLARSARGEDFDELFGGSVEPDDTYRVNITSHIQDMSRGQVTEKMMFTLFLKSEQAARAVLGGPGNADSPARLEVTFTNF